jgi:hypothetical protein
MDFKTTDLCDEFSDRLQIAEPLFGDYGGETMFSVVIVTLKVFEDNSLVRTALEQPRAKAGCWWWTVAARCAARYWAISSPNWPRRTTGPAWW